MQRKGGFPSPPILLELFCSLWRNITAATSDGLPFPPAEGSMMLASVIEQGHPTAGPQGINV